MSLCALRQFVYTVKWPRDIVHYPNDRLSQRCVSPPWTRSVQPSLLNPMLIVENAKASSGSFFDARCTLAGGGSTEQLSGIHYVNMLGSFMCASPPQSHVRYYMIFSTITSCPSAKRAVAASSGLISTRARCAEVAGGPALTCTDRSPPYHQRM